MGKIKKIRIYNLGIIPIIVKTYEDCKKAGEMVQQMAIKAIWRK